MSIQIMNWVFYDEEETKDAERLVLLALADQANDEGYCWPGQKRLAKKANVDRSSLPEIERRLIEKRLITIEPRKSPDGRDMSNLFRIVWTYEIEEEERKAGRLGRVAERNPGEGCPAQGGGLPSATLRVAQRKGEGCPAQPESLINPSLTPTEQGDIFQHAEKNWIAAKGQLQQEMTKSAFDTWVRDLRVRTSQGAYILMTHNGYARDWIEARLASTIRRIITGLEGREIDVSVVVE